VWLFGALFVPAAVALAEAQGSEPIVAVEAKGTCPEASAVRSVLAGLVPPNAPPGASATVADHGATYAVSIGDRSKSYGDPSRDCAQRARVAAAFISLALLPDALPDTPPKPPESPPAPPPAGEGPRGTTGPVPEPTHDIPTPPHAFWVRVDARAVVANAPEDQVFAPGVALGMAAGKGPFGGALSCGWVTGASIATGGGSGVLLDRFPCAIGPLARMTWVPGLLDVHVGAAFVAGALRARGTGFASVYDAVRLELGARASIDALLRFGRSDLAAILGLEATYDPATYDLEATPRGVVAHTPSVWAGANAGLSWGLP
jgi:hypothetical protein